VKGKAAKTRKSLHGFTDSGWKRSPYRGRGVLQVKTHITNTPFIFETD
jgi:hypothetical protein